MGGELRAASFWELMLDTWMSGLLTLGVVIVILALTTLLTLFMMGWSES
jgi:hypothetical protein